MISLVPSVKTFTFVSKSFFVIYAAIAVAGKAVFVDQTICKDFFGYFWKLVCLFQRGQVQLKGSEFEKAIKNVIWGCKNRMPKQMFS